MRRWKAAAIARKRATARPRASNAHPQRRGSVPWRVIEGDCFDRLADLGSDTIDAVVTDPPYGIGFQGVDWDGKAIRKRATQSSGHRLSAGNALHVWHATWTAECRRALKPGGHLLAFGAPRTVHRLATGLEDGGLELRDMLMWLYGTGMPKSRRLSGGAGTTLKPAWEPILLARKTPDGSIEHNRAAHATGALNIDPCRVEGRHPANVVADHADACTSTACTPDCPRALINATASRTAAFRRAPSRLFYCPKASSAERDAGCEHLPEAALEVFEQTHGPRAARNPHPTVKPLALMRWLVRLVTPAGGIVLDPFCGSGTTGAATVLERRRFIGIEREPAYAEIARTRVAHWSDRVERPRCEQGGRGHVRPRRKRRRRPGREFAE
jgi:site-specific DNA-methyltransferase (adenine-specific)